MPIAKIWWKPQVQRRTRSSALSDRGLHCNQEDWLKELEDTSPANEAKEQNATSSSRTKLLENGRDSETSTIREPIADVDVDNVDLEISSFWLHEAWFQKMSGEQRRLHLNNIIPMPPTIFSKSKKSRQFNLVVCRFSDDFISTGFCARIIDVCFFQVVITHCCGKLTHADICQCGGDF